MSAISFARRVVPVVIAIAAIAGLKVAAAGAPNIGAYIVDASGTVINGVVEASFKISVENHEAADVTDFAILFNDDSSVMIGTVPAGETVVSARINKALDLSSTRTNNPTIPVTLKYTFNGAAVEQAYTLTHAGK